MRWSANEAAWVKSFRLAAINVWVESSSSLQLPPASQERQPLLISEESTEFLYLEPGLIIRQKLCWRVAQEVTQVKRSLSKDSACGPFTLPHTHSKICSVPLSSLYTVTERGLTTPHPRPPFQSALSPASLLPAQISLSLWLPQVGFRLVSFLYVSKWNLQSENEMLFASVLAWLIVVLSFDTFTDSVASSFPYERLSWQHSPTHLWQITPHLVAMRCTTSRNLAASRNTQASLLRLSLVRDNKYSQYTKSSTCLVFGLVVQSSCLLCLPLFLFNLYRFRPIKDLIRLHSG